MKTFVLLDCILPYKCVSQGGSRDTPIRDTSYFKLTNQTTLQSAVAGAMLRAMLRFVHSSDTAQDISLLGSLHLFRFGIPRLLLFPFCNP